jgi:hypothetical protein
VDSFRQLRSQWDRVGAVVLTLVGGLCLILGYFGVSRQGLAPEQIPYIVSGGLGGIFLMGVGAALWLSADLRDEWRKLDRIEVVLEEGLERLGLGRHPDGSPTVAPLTRGTEAVELVGLDGDDDDEANTIETAEVSAGANGTARRARPHTETSKATPGNRKVAERNDTNGTGTRKPRSGAGSRK